MYNLSKYAGERVNTEPGILAMYPLILDLVIYANTLCYTHALFYSFYREKSIFVPGLRWFPELETV